MKYIKLFEDVSKEYIDKYVDSIKDIFIELTQDRDFFLKLSPEYGFSNILYDDKSINFDGSKIVLYRKNMRYFTFSEIEEYILMLTDFINSNSEHIDINFKIRRKIQNGNFVSLNVKSNSILKYKDKQLDFIQIILTKK